ncbi:receptor-like protein 7 [Zea mays]|uniref:Disease resistance R13L4/SHOC-2-like LRR domain-containing protein n=1 Tax=Zea mays TaxID=4577 RepID=A0A804ULN8_MAIZE|nr:receptor-like protein 7 [Zea mays]|eukprot:XP_020401390.1 receptor-like protein 12 [Zea mays]
MLARTSLLPIEQVKPTSITNFVSLKELVLSGNLASVDFLSSFGTLGSLCKLELTFDEVSELGPVFSWIGHHKNLTSLVLSGNFSEMTPTLVSNFKALRSLSMHDCTLPRHVLDAVGNLIALRTLDLYYCNITWGSTMPSSIGNLTNLRDLHIIQCGFSGPMPAAIGRLTNLRNMYVFRSGFSGPIPAAIGKLTSLEILDIEDGFSGPIPATIGNLSHLNRMRSFGSNFSGRIPGSMANLTQLTEMILPYNSLNGEIPPFIFTLPALCYLDLSNNQLSGHVQDFDTTTSRLKSLFLSNNALSGFIPKAFFELTSLGALDVSSNNFTGSLDLSHFWRLHELTMLDLSNNWLHVMDADDDNLVDISYLSELQDIRLASCNVIRFPRFLRQVKSISYLDLSRNKIDGNVPNWLWDKLWSFAPYLNLSHNMFTGMQLINSYILPFSTSMEVLDLSFNRFSGRVPMPSSSGEVLEYSNNMFSSLVPNWTLYLRDTIYFSISKNNINDQLPPSICDAILDVLDLSNNNFYGPIPSCIIENMTHTILNLRGNNFNGTLPTDIMTTCDLQVLDLHGNKIEGRLPRGLSKCFHLEILDISSNRMLILFLLG